MWSNVVGKNRKSDEEHEDCVEEGFQLIRRKKDRDGERQEAVGKGYCSTNI